MIRTTFEAPRDPNPGLTLQQDLGGFGKKRTSSRGDAGVPTDEVSLNIDSNTRIDV
jgi:hypothetical protein